MLQCDIKNGEYTKIEMQGKFDEILSDTLNLIKAVHKGIRETNPTLAGAYRQYLSQAVLDPTSGVWEIDDRYIKVSFDAVDDKGDGGILQ